MTRSGLVALLMVMAACTPPNPRVATKVNELAGLTGDLPAANNPLLWRVITSGVNLNNSTMYTLYGNNVAAQYARTNTERDYPAGASLALVTWQRHEDARWFGAEIPARADSVELLDVTISAEGHPFRSYRLYKGMPLQEVTMLQSQAERGVARLLSLRPAVMP